MTELVGTNVGAPRRWRLIYQRRPWTAAQEQKMTPTEREEIVAAWRHALGALARAEGVPALGLVSIVALPVISAGGARRRFAAGACYGAVTAAIDGLVDVGALSSPESIIALTMLQPAIGDEGRLVITITDAAGGRP